MFGEKCQDYVAPRMIDVLPSEHGELVHRGLINSEEVIVEL